MGAMFIPIVMQLGRVVLQAGTRSVFNFLKKQGFKQIAKNSKKAKNAPKVTKLNQVKKLQKSTKNQPKVQTQTKPTSQVKPKNQQKKTQQNKKPKDNKPKDQKKPGNIITRNPGKTLTALTTAGAFTLGQLTGPEKMESMPKKKDVKVSDNKKTSETKPLEKKQNTQPLKKLRDVKVKTFKTKKISPPKEDKPKRTNITAGGNVGFGLKGNIFASNEDDRKRLMAKFGGTGSAAARAAMKGTQGNIKSKSKKGHTDMRKGGLFYG